MKDFEFPDQGARQSNIKSGDLAAINKAVNRQAAQERQQVRQEVAQLRREAPYQNVRRPVNQMPVQNAKRPMPPRQAQNPNVRQQMVQRSAQNVNIRQPMPAKPVQAARPQMPQRPVQPQPVPKMQMPQEPAPNVAARPKAPVDPSQIPEMRMAVPQRQVRHLTPGMPVPHRPGQPANAVVTVPQNIAVPRHVAPLSVEHKGVKKEAESEFEEFKYEEPKNEDADIEEEEYDGSELEDSEYDGVEYVNDEDDDESEEEEDAVSERAPRARKEKKEKKRHSLIPYLIILLLVILVGAAAVWAINIYTEDTGLIVYENSVEAGSSANLQMFIKGEPKFQEYVSCNLDFTAVNYQLPQTIRFNIRMYGTNFPCVLNIVDTTPPVAEAVPQTMFSVDEIPPVENCVKNVSDLTDVTIKWKDVPDISAGGNIIAKASVTDASGNETIVEVPFMVTRDSIAPVIEGTKNISAMIGDTIKYRDGVTVTDDIDKNPNLEIDTSKVDLKKAGTYVVTYRATDFTGNSTEVEIKLTLKKKPKTYVEPEKVETEAKKVLKKIIKSNMTDMEKAIQITWWVRYHLNYVGTADNSSWTRAAYDGLTKRRGNCYNFAMTAKALFDAAGIENMIIKREPYIYHPHYWNYIKINGEWYHCDSTPRIKYNSYFFMYTTKELKNFWHNGWNGYNFKENKYPKSATKSVQKKINYAGHSIKK